MTGLPEDIVVAPSCRFSDHVYVMVYHHTLTPTEAVTLAQALLDVAAQVEAAQERKE